MGYKRRGSAYAKDVRREVIKSLSRFLSIFLIIALGTGFFAGIKSTMPDMKESAAAFFYDNRLMDLKLMSNIGFQYEDLQQVEQLDGIAGVSAGYSCDVYYNYDGQNQVVKVMSYAVGSSEADESFLNRPILLEGRMPERSGECVVETTMKTPATYRIGESLTFSSPYKDKGIESFFATDTFTVVGIVASPLYIGFERDSTTVGNGTVNSFVLIPEDDFTIGSYTELYVRFEGLEEYEPFSDEYIAKVNEKKAAVIQAFEASVAKRFDKMKANYQDRISSAEKSIAEIEAVAALDTDELFGYCSTLSQEIEALEADSAAVSRISATKKRAVLDKAQKLLDSRLAGSDEADIELAGIIAEAKQSAQEARTGLALIPELKVYDFSRFSSSDYASFAGDSEKIDAISKVFPVFFLFIAALVCLTTMTRMVDEHRTEIGTYKALGYSSGKIIAKYLIYALVPTVSGTLFGTAVGFKVIPSVIYNSYKILYNIPSIETPFRTGYAVGCALAAVLCVSAVVMSSCYAALSAQPAQLMRPKAPPAGRRVFLERFGWLWGKLSFLTKVAVRNLLRYKKRFAMTLVGVAGCCALIMTGFGIKHSISEIAYLQFNEIFSYDAVAVVSSDASPSALDEFVADEEGISDALRISETDCYMSFDGETQAAAIVVAQDADKLGQFVTLRDCGSGEITAVAEDKAVITEKISQLLDISKGDVVTLEVADRQPVEIEVSAVVENYAMHYVYITPQTCERLFGEVFDCNQLLLKVSGDADRVKLSESLVGSDEILGMAYMSDKAESFVSSLESLDAIVWLLIVCAALLAFVVLYNLANININERVREIATLKVLGFYDGETSAYIYRENVFTTLIGIVIGWAAGLVLHRFVVRTAEVDVVMFAREMVWYGYVLSALLTIVFAVIVNAVLHFKLKSVDMVRSLKSIE